MSFQTLPTLFDIGHESEAKIDDSVEMRAVRALILDISEKSQMTPAKQVLVVTALALAQNIARGNMKGRSIANEAAQLAAIVEQLTAEVGDAAGMTDETKDLIRALTIDPAAYAEPQARIDSTES